MKRLAIVAVAVLTLTGCGSGADNAAGTESSNLIERTIDLTDGREVTCIIYGTGYRGGLSCDWGGAR
jgi:hypothetical protein